MPSVAMQIGGGVEVPCVSVVVGTEPLCPVH